MLFTNHKAVTDIQETQKGSDSEALVYIGFPVIVLSYRMSDV